MCNKACLDFGRENLPREDVEGKRVIEIGSRDVNGSLRPIAEEQNPERYIGVDLEPGSGVDEVCNVYDLVDRYGRESFDVVISTEMVEHVHDWRKAFSQMKTILRPGGIIVITTRSIGFPYHDYPFDYWRYELDDMRAIFSDMKVETLKPDELSPGVLVKARKPENFVENDLSGHALFSMVTNSRTAKADFSKLEYLLLSIRTSFLARKLEGAKRKIFSNA